MSAVAVVGAANAALLIAVILLVAHRRAERRHVARFAAEATRGAPDALTAALRLAGVVHRSVARGHDDPPFLLPVLAPLGATPTAVLQRGGCCSGISRLFILSLDALGIPAAQVTLYHVDGRAQHCLVEATIGDGRWIIDPMYGFYYHRADGGPIGLEELQRGERPCFSPLPLTSRGAAYPDNSYYHFAYERTKTANWTKGWARRLAYQTLTPLTAGGIDRLRLPPVLEWPQMILAFALLAGAAGANALAAAAFWAGIAR